MRVTFSESKKGVMAIAGHAGCGHSNSHSGSVQDDSSGLATVLALFQEAGALDLTVESVEAEPGTGGYFHVKTVSGGEGRCRARRGITMQEARLAGSLVGKEALRTQALVMDVFGRCGGQGSHEAPVALQTALANAAVDSFVRSFPERFAAGSEALPGSGGRIAGTILDIGDIPVAVLATVNASTDGTGPVEDLEGNVFAGEKKSVMQRLGMEGLPTIVVESKIYAATYSTGKDAPYFLVRADPTADNPVVAEALVEALEALGLRYEFRDDVMARKPGDLENATRLLADSIIAAGGRLKNARLSREKTAILADLARLVSEDGGGISFMSDRLHEIVGGTGMMPGSAAVLSLVIPESLRDKQVLPFLTERDVREYTAAVKAAAGKLRPLLGRAAAHAAAHASPEDLDGLL